jgi:hypothetical protein
VSIALMPLNYQHLGAFHLTLSGGSGSTWLMNPALTVRAMSLMPAPAGTALLSISVVCTLRVIAIVLTTP